MKTLKRDYAQVTLLPDAPTILGLVAGLDRGLQHQPPALRPADALTPRVPRPLCLTQPAPCPVKRGARAMNCYASSSRQASTQGIPCVLTQRLAAKWRGRRIASSMKP